MTSMIANLDISQAHERREEIRHEVAVNRLESTLRANRGARPRRLVRDLGWELARYGGSLAKRLRLSER